MTGVGWRWTFLLPVPIALVALAAAYVLLPKDSPPRTAATTCPARPFSTGAMLLLVYTVVTAPEVGLGLGPDRRLVRRWSPPCSPRSSSSRAGSSTR